MKSFHFTLEALGTLRQRQEQKAMEQYAQSLIVRRQAVDGLEAVERELSACWQEWRNRLAGGCAAAEAAQAHAYQRSLAQRRNECALALETAERRVNAALQGMLAWRASSGRSWTNVLTNKRPATGASRPAANKNSWMTWPAAGATPFSPGSRRKLRYDKITHLTLDDDAGQRRRLSDATVAFWKTPALPSSPTLTESAAAREKHNGPSWDFTSPEADQLIAELKAEKKSLGKKEQELNDLSLRLQAERSELNLVTQSVRQLQLDFDQNVLRISEEETANLKKLAKVYADMDPRTPPRFWRKWMTPRSSRSWSL